MLNKCIITKYLINKRDFHAHVNMTEWFVN